MALLDWQNADVGKDSIIEPAILPIAPVKVPRCRAPMLMSRLEWWSKTYADLILDRFKRTIVRLQSRARGQPNDNILARLEPDTVTGFAQRRLYCEGAGPAIYGDIHEAIEGDWDHVFTDSKRRKRIRQIAETPAMRVGIPIDNSKCVFAARG